MLPLVLKGLICGCGVTADSQIPPPIKPVAAVVDVATTVATAPIWLLYSEGRDEVTKNYNLGGHKPGSDPDPGPVLIYKAGDRSVSNSSPKKIEP